MSIKIHLKLSEMMAFENKLHSAVDNFRKNTAELICGLMMFPLAIICKPPINFSTEGE